MISKSFLKSSIIITLSGALPMVGGIILLPFYTNYLPTLQFTQLAYYILITLLTQIIFSFSIDTYYGVKYTQLANEPQEQKKFTGTISILLLLIGIILLLLFSISGDFLFSTCFVPEFEMEFWPWGFYSILTGFFNAYFKTATNCLIYFKKERLYFGVNFINFVATLVISIGGLKLFPDSLIGPMYGRLLSGAIIFLLAQYIYSSNGTLKFEKTFLKDLMVFCSPYVLVVFCFWILGNVDRLFLQHFISNIEINAYDTVMKCFFGVMFVQNGLSAVIFPKVYEIWKKEGENKTTKESNRYFNVFNFVNIMQLIFFCIVIPVLYKIFINKPEFYQSDQYIGLLATTYALTGILNYYLATIQFTKNSILLLKIYLITAAFQIALTYFGIKHFALLGAIYATLITKVIQVILTVLLTKNIFKYEYNYFKIIGLPFIFIVYNIIQYQISPDYNLYLYLGQFTLFSIVFYFIFKNEIKVVFQQYLKLK
ncbi:MAG: hypothetical protein IPM51_05395 [Sphingobacteriaceae bacterium]|nr:hypothetical protein [Sphingobacteriaceae bacterium]